MNAIRFFVGLHQPSDAKHFERACISINRLLERKRQLGCAEVLVDSGAFTEISRHGGYRRDVASYAADLRRIAGILPAVAAVAQDFMCEPFIVRRTGLSVERHQQLTIERYDALLDAGVPMPVMPVLQGYAPDDYARHLESYGDRLRFGAWVGVGSVCKRNSSPADVVEVLWAITRSRPDLRLHGFGLKKTALLDPGVRSMIYSADSMAWSFHARKNGRSANDWREAEAFRIQVERAAALPPAAWQMPLPLGSAA